MAAVSTPATPPRPRRGTTRSSRGGGPSRRFAFLSTCPEPWGGSEELWYAAASQLRRAGHGVHVLKTVVDDEHPRIRALRAAGVSVRDMATASSLAAWGTGAALMPNRWRPTDVHRQLVLAGSALARQRPDLAVICQGQNFDGLYLARLCQRLRIAYVIVSQKASELSWPPDHVRAYGRRAFARARCAVFVCRHNLRLTEAQFGTALDNVTLIRNPVLVAPNSSLPWPDGPELRLACVGRMNIAEKGQDLLLRVLAQPRWRERPVRLSLFGGGMHEASLRDMAGSLQVDRIEFAGHTADITQVWRRHHLLVLPSRAEGLPLVLLEAMACGRPAVVSDVGGSAELVEDGVNGFVAAEASFQALADALERTWLHRNELPQLGAAAAERIATLPAESSAGALAPMLLRQAVGARR